MRHRILKIFGIGMLAILCMIMYLPAQSVQASSLLDTKEQLTEEETTEESSEDIGYPRTRSNHLNLGNIRITKEGTNECGIYGLTQAYHECEMLYLTLYLEQKNGGSYNTYKTWTFTAMNESSLSKSFNVLVPENHYYRVSGYHAAKEGGIKESTTTQTKGVWIGD